VLPSAVDDATQVFSGLFNEVISSSLARYLPPTVEAVGDEEETKKEKDDFVHIQAATSKANLPASLEESLL